jgi:hypothetical protein
VKSVHSANRIANRPQSDIWTIKRIDAIKGVCNGRCVLSLKSNTLLTRRFNLLGWSEYKLVESGVTVREKDIKGIREVTIEYDRIGKEAKYYVHRSVKALLALVLFALFSAATALVNFVHGDAEQYAWVFWMVLALITLIFYTASIRKGFRLQSDFSTLLVIGNMRETQEFLRVLMERKAIFIEQRVQQYCCMIERPDVEKYLLGLRDGSVLTPEQYEATREKIYINYDPKAKIGFQP